MGARDAKGRFIKGGKRPKLSASMSPTMAVFINPRERRKMNNLFGNWQKRAEDAKRFVMLEAAGILLDELKAAGPEINGFDYTEKLEIGEIPKEGDDFIVAILMSSQEERRYRAALVQFDDAEPVTSEEDTRLGMDVLRKEYGLRRQSVTVAEGSEGVSEEGQVAHWRPAIRKLSQRVAELQRKYVKYVETGRMGIWNLPKTRKISMSELDSGKWFQEKIKVAL